jgi:hypothetical protein
MSRRRIGFVVLGLVAVLVVAGVVVSRKASAHEVFLEPANSVGAHPFTTVGAVTATSTTATSTTATTAVGETTTTALFGGTGSQKRCDPDALVAFLMAHRDKATAWVEALNDDPMLKWSKDGTDTLFSKLTVDDIAAYVAGLTPTFLAKDTRVENHGFVNGKATPHESVLQAGTAVLVDKYGVPRTRCACGNPLDLPEPVDHVKYVGECWPGCHDHPYCSGGDCVVTTTTTEPTSTTEPPTTSTLPCNPTTGEGCGPPSTRPPGTTTTRPSSGSTSTSKPATTTTKPPTSTTRTTTPPTTQTPRTTTPTTQPGKP